VERIDAAPETRLREPGPGTWSRDTAPPD